MPGGTRSSSRRKGGESDQRTGGAAMTSGVKRGTRNSGIAVDVNLWDLRDLPKTSTIKRAPKLKLKDYTVRLPRASRDQDMKQLRRAAMDNEGVGDSDPVYPLTGPACITRKEAAAALLALGEERDDAMVATAKAAVSESGDCGAGVRSTIADGSIPLAMGINQPLLAEAEADARLASPGVSRNLTREDQRSSLPHPAQLYHAQGKPDSSDGTTDAMSAAAKIAPARAGDVPGSSGSSGGGGGAFDGVAGGGVGGGQGPRFKPEHGVGGSTSSNKYVRVIGDGHVGGDPSMVDRLGNIGCVWGSSAGHHGQGGDDGGKAGEGCYGNGGGASGDHAESDGAHTSGSRGYSGVTTSDDNDSSSGGYGNGLFMTTTTTTTTTTTSGGGQVRDSCASHHKSRPDEGKGCDGPSSASSPTSPSRDSCLGKQKRENSNDDVGGGAEVISKRVKTEGRYYSHSGGSGGSGSSGVTTSDGNDSSSSSSSSTGGGGGIISASSNSSSSSTGGGIAWDNATDNTGGCDVSPSELSPPSPSRDISTFGKRKRGHDDDNDEDDMVDGSGCVDVNKASGDDGASERCAKRARQAAGGGQSRQLRGSRDRSGK
ncbi:unnamed protein product [Ectocarpus sp. 4 AP-2014]